MACLRQAAGEISCTSRAQVGSERGDEGGGSHLSWMKIDPWPARGPRHRPGHRGEGKGTGVERCWLHQMIMSVPMHRATAGKALGVGSVLYS